MDIISYFECNQQAKLKEAIAACDWSAARFLVELLEKGTFDETLGGWGELYLLMDGGNLVSFATFTGQDAVRDESLTPWIGFVYTVPNIGDTVMPGRCLPTQKRRQQSVATVKSILPRIISAFMRSTVMPIRKTVWIAGAMICGYCIRIWRKQNENHQSYGR